MAEKTLTIPAADPNLVPGLTRPTSASWRIWAIVFVSLVAATGLLGALLHGQGHDQGAKIAVLAGCAIDLLWLAWGAWTWRHVPVVNRAGKLYLATAIIAGAVGLLAAFVGVGHLTWVVWRQIAISVGGFWGMTLLFIVGLWLVRLLLAPSWPFLGVARTLIDEAIRMKIALVFILCLAIIVPFLPLILDSKERLQYRVQFFMYWTVAGTGFLLSLMTIFLACGTICDEIKNRQIFLTMTKPVSRFQYLLGKWLGIVLLDLLLVSVAGLGIYAGIFWLSEQTDRGQADRYALNTEVLLARQGVTPTSPDNLDTQQLYEKRLKEMRTENQPDPTKVRSGPPSQAEDKEVKSWMTAHWYAIGPGEANTYVFHGLTPAKEFKNRLQLRVKATASRDPPDHKLLLAIFLNDRPFNVMPDGRQYPIPIHTNQYDIISLPVEAINDQGEVSLKVENLMPVTVDFQAGNGLEVLYRTDSFLPNFVRGLVIVWLKLVFLAMLGLTAGTFLGFPVACLLGIVIFVLADFSAFISEALSTFAAGSMAKSEGVVVTIMGIWSTTIHGEIGNALALVVASIDKIMMSVFSAFGSFDPVSLMVDGRLISGQMVLSATIWIVLIWTLLCGLVGLAIFYRRELARVTV